MNDHVIKWIKAPTFTRSDYESMCELHACILLDFLYIQYYYIIIVSAY